MPTFEMQRLTRDLYERLRMQVGEFVKTVPRDVSPQDLSVIVGGGIAAVLAEAYPVTLQRRLTEKEHAELTGHLRNVCQGWLSKHPPAQLN